MQELKVYEITTNTDTTEGRGQTVGTGICFLNKSAAREFAASDHYKPFAVMGYVYKSTAKFNVRAQVLYIYDHMTDYKENIEEVKKKKALEKIMNKLTDKEIKIIKASLK